MDELSINEYLNIRGITIVGQYFNYDKRIDKKDIISQINLIVEVHKTLVGCNFNGMSRIKSTIGKEVEDYKVQIKKLQRHYDYVVSKPCTNEVEKLIYLKRSCFVWKSKYWAQGAVNAKNLRRM